MLPVGRSAFAMPFCIGETWVSVLPVNLGCFGSFVLPFTEISFTLATVRIVCSWSSLRKREGARPIWLEMSGKTLSSKSVESGIFEPRKNTELSCSTILRNPFQVSFSFSTGFFSCTISCGSCLIDIGFGNAHNPILGGIGGGIIGISVRLTVKGVGF